MIKFKEENDDNAFLEHRKLLVSKEELEKLYAILKEDYKKRSTDDIWYDEESPFFILSNKLRQKRDSYEITAGFLYEVLEKIHSKTEIHVSTGSSEFISSENWIKNTNRYYAIFNSQDLETYFSNLILNKDIDHVEELIHLECAICKESTDFILLRDLTKAKEELLKDLKYVCSDEEFLYFQTYLNHRSFDIQNLKKVLQLGQEKIKEDWKKQVTDISSYKAGDSFSFLCHSMLHSEFEGDDFYTKYISTSLLTEKLWDTFAYGYGFIFSPNTIVSASSYDTYSVNTALSDKEIFHYSDVASIFSKQRIEEECVALKKKNIEDRNNEKVYSEVLIKGFYPIGIFCITDGSKLDYNYQHAQYLKDNVAHIFPDLPIIELDKTFYCSEEERKQIFQKMLENLQKQTHIDRNEEVDYAPLFINFMISKKEGTYNANEFKEKYKEMSELDVIEDDKKTY